ncbi:MAG: hypothetical protein SCH39_01385 [Methanosarcinales archaeon]|nr:hypothetical protein [Methanosarcinales archaeon]
MPYDFEAFYTSLNLLLVTLSFIVLIFSGGIAYITRKLWYATAGASYFWMFLSAFTGSIAVYAVANFAKVTFLKDYAVPLQAIMDVGLVSAAVYAFVSAIFIRKMFEELGK